ncbi:NAC domain-containing protein 83-like [Rosa chinensis]|uniref:NAC domain-containing protein 83-like n=1 Tax=Rosa chinensis TaxID=74649 RepID=UPI000D08B96A|nr:NAC domain-containing protein 83-like [Rosa chinensis]
MQQQFAVEESRGNDQLPGERFCPMEDELVLFYLKPMLSGEMVPGRNRVVFDCDLYGHQEPWEIWEAYKTRRPNDLRLNKDIYFFTQHKTMSSTDTRIHRTVGNGTWKGDDSGKPVKSLETSRVVGLKKRLTYKNQASEHNGCWILYEFYLDPSLRDKKQKVEDYVLCLLRKMVNPKPRSKRGENNVKRKTFLKTIMPVMMETTQTRSNLKLSDNEWGSRMGDSNTLFPRFNQATIMECLFHYRRKISSGRKCYNKWVLETIMEYRRKIFCG